MSDSVKYPPNIQKLFAPKPPLPYIPPTDYPSESRKTSTISPVSSLKNQIQNSIKEISEYEQKNPRPQPSKQQVEYNNGKIRKQKLKESLARQIQEWNDPELLQKNEKQFMKDPYHTVFISRLDYELTELELSKHFSKYGVIDSIRIIRDKQGKSRGYGFVVFEKDSDAANCVNDLARSGLKISLGETTTKPILVDIERGRIIRNWKPRRLGGGLGGRHYTKPDVRGANTASAAASGRRIHVANNPHFPPANGSSNYTPPPGHGPSLHAPPSYRAPVNKPAYSGIPMSLASSTSVEEKSLRDKYAKYSSSSYESSSARRSDDSRSIRNIRRRE